MRVKVCLAAILGTLAVAACGGAPPASSPARTSANPSPSAIATATMTAAPVPTATRVPASPSPVAASPGEGSLTTDPADELEPGTYRVASPPMTFTIPTPTDDARWFGAADPRGGFAIRRATSACDGCEAGQIAVIVTPESVDAAVAEWTALEDVSLTSAEPAELGGATGVRFEGVTPQELGVTIVHGGFNPHGYVAVYVLDVGGQAVVVVINQYEQPTDFVDDARPVVESFRFDV